MTWGDPSAKRSCRGVSSHSTPNNKCPYEFEVEEEAKMLPPPPLLRPLRIEKSPTRLSLGSSPLSPISPSPFRPSNDSPVKTPEKKSPKKDSLSADKGELVVVNGRGRRKIRQKRKIGRPFKNREPSQDDSISPPRQVKRKKPGRKPGRPAKEKSDNQPPRKLGRPLKRKPGRPKKIVENETEDNKSKPGLGKVKPQKVPGRRPGRPRKNAPKIVPEKKDKDSDESHKESGDDEKGTKIDITEKNDEDGTEIPKEDKDLPSSERAISISPAPKKSKAAEDKGDSSSSNESSDSSNSDSSDSDDDDNDDDDDEEEEDDNDGDNDDSEEEEKSKADVGIPKETPHNYVPELKTKVRRLSASSSDDSDVLPRKSDVSSSKRDDNSLLKKSDDDSGDNRKQGNTTSTTKMFSDSDSDSDEDLKRLGEDEKEETSNGKEDGIGLPSEPIEEDEDEDNIASQNLAVLVKEYDAEVKKPTESADPELPASVHSDGAQESASYGTVDELSDNFSDPPTPADPQIPSSPPPAPAPVRVNSDDDEMPSPTRSMGRGPTPTPPHLTQPEQSMEHKSADPMLSSPSHHQQVQHQQLSSQINNGQHQQLMLSPGNSGNQSKPSMPVIVPPSPIMVSASPEVKQHPLTPSNQQMPTPSSVKSHEDVSYQSVGSNQGQQPLPSPAAAQLTSPGHLTSPGQYQHTSPAQQQQQPQQMTSPSHHQQLTSPGQHYQPLTSPGQQQPLTSPVHLHSPAQMIGQHQQQQEKHLSPMASSPSMPQQQHQQKNLTAQAAAIAQARSSGKAQSSRSQGRSRSASVTSQSRGIPPSFHQTPTGPPPLSGINTLQHQSYEMSVSLGGLGSPASISSGSGSSDMPSDSSQQQHSMSNLNYDCAQNTQYCNNNLQVRNSFMDTVNISSLQAQQQGQPSYISPITTSLVPPPRGSPLSTYSPSMLPPPSQAHQSQHQRQQQQQHQRQQHQQSPSAQQTLHQQPQNSPRLVHTSTSLPTVVQQAMLQGGSMGLYQPGQQPNSCDLLKLQQLTNRIQDLPPESLQQMTPPQNMTPPPSTSAINMTPPPSMTMMRPIVTTPIPGTLPGSIPPHLALMGQPTAPPFKRQRSSSSASSRKTASVPPPPISNSSNNPHVTLNPGNMGGLSPNVTIQPGTSGAAGMFPRYLNYRLPQGMIQPSYITNSHGFLQPQQIPMQMQMMNMHPGGPAAQQAAAFQQQVQQGQPGNASVYTPYYINANNVMRR
ncbi:histone acetyltransferase [Plakobranchus ocellatus]|uniref:Histone acetyltransferase n=1 Tax=Plakobranchus ocellatus TaxID=259542 RepID=A0AAV3YH54_9GAST|nr:histone acetyltransferase [Plakobranchus ocellatus]